jgi:hypothetical protein
VEAPSERWRRCSTCKKDIAFRAVYWVCSVSTCNRVRSALQFCSVGCWDSHVPILRHRDAWAVEERAPTREEAQREAIERAERAAAPPTRPSPAPAPASQSTRTTGSASPAPVAATARPAEKSMEKREGNESGPREVLVVVSKLKNYVRARSGFNCSDRVMEMLSDHVRAVCDRAIESARADSRKTVLERDVPKVV